MSKISPWEAMEMLQLLYVCLQLRFDRLHLIFDQLNNVLFHFCSLYFIGVSGYLISGKDPKSWIRWHYPSFSFPKPWSKRWKEAVFLWRVKWSEAKLWKTKKNKKKPNQRGLLTAWLCSPHTATLWTLWNVTICNTEIRETTGNCGSGSFLLAQIKIENCVHSFATYHRRKPPPGDL